MLVRSAATGSAAIMLSALLGASVQAQVDRLPYPDTRRIDHVDTLHGVEIADPYRWLEDLDSPETRAWIEAENEVTFNYLHRIPQREAILNRLTRLWDYERFGIPEQDGGRYFYSRNDGLQNQAVFYVAESLEAEPRILLDPNTWSADGTIALQETYPTDDGSKLAYTVANAGSDWVEIRTLDVETGKVLPDVIKWVKFSGAAWTPEGDGFYYSRYDQPQEGNPLSEQNFFQKLYFHKLGTPQSDDRLVYETPDHKDWGFGGSVTEDGQYLIIGVWQGTEPKNRVYYRDLEESDGQVVKLLDDFDAKYNFVGNDGPVFWFFTDLDAPRGRLIAIDTQNPARPNWTEIIPQSDDTLVGVSVVGHRFIAQYLQDAHSQVRVFELDGNHAYDLKLPSIGSAGGFGGQSTDTETFYAFTNDSTPSTIYRLVVETGESDVFRRPKVDFNPEDYTTEQVFYESKDGTRIPMFLTYRKGLRRNGDNPTLLYGYGGFNIPVTPRFRTGNIVWLDMGGIYAVANIRGGGEYGQAWHDAGRLKSKQNCFDDFIAAGEWLIANQYTRSEKLAILGGSNGGLLVGACITQRPDLFGAAIPIVGVMDMLRFHEFTIGWAWKSDFGDPADPEMFKVLRAYSPYHNIKPGTRYPATLIVTGDHDDRVVPSHSFKFAAAMQAAQVGDAPVLIRIETRAGHGAGKPTSKIIEEEADRWAFLVQNLNVAAQVKH